MLAYVLRRIATAGLTLFGITVISFAVMRLSPGDPVSLMVAGAQDLSSADLVAVRQAYGLDRPLVVQYLAWLDHLATGDFGRSYLYHRPVTEMIAATLPNTLQLSLAALGVALVVGVSLGILSAYWRGSLFDQLVRVFAVAGHAIPAFWLGLLVILVFSVQFGWLPSGGILSTGADEWNLLDRTRHLIGPVLVLSLAGVANYSRYMRTELLEVLGQDFIRTARSKGLVARLVLSRHALRNALLPLITALGAVFASLVSGSVVVEQVFSWPGMGRLAFDAARSKDYPVVMAVVVISSALLLFGYFLRDLAYGLADPRVR